MNNRNLTPNEINKTINQTLKSLTAERLIAAFKKAKKNYIQGNPEDLRKNLKYYGGSLFVESSRHCDAIVNKDIVTLGVSSAVRAEKATKRIPDFSTITDENAIEIIIDFLNSKKGNQGLYSLKYMVVSELLGIKVTQNEDAESLIDNITRRFCFTIKKDEEEIAENPESRFSPFNQL